MLMKEMICIVCPQGCRLTVDPDRDYQVTGNRCIRGIAYGQSEAKDPRRILTSTVCMTGSRHRRCPVKTDGPIPKKDMARAMALLDQVVLSPPVRRGDIILGRILGHPVNFVASRDLLD